MYQLIYRTAPLLFFHDHWTTPVHAPRRTLVTFSGTQLLIDGCAGGLLTQPYKELIPKTIGNRKEIVREVARGDKPYLRKSTDRKAQISPLN